MPLHFTCPACKKSLKVPDNLAGQKVACNHCGQRMIVPAIPVAPVAAELDELKVADDEQSQKRSSEKFCHECGVIIRAKASVCPDCGVDQADVDETRKKYCHECGALIRGKAAICPKCGVEQDAASSGSTVSGNAGCNRTTAGLLAILLGPLGIHKFMLGYTGAGVIMLLVSIFGTCLYGAGPLIMCVIGIVEGVIYLSMSDKDFQRIHGRKTKAWF